MQIIKNRRVIGKILIRKQLEGKTDPFQASFKPFPSSFEGPRRRFGTNSTHLSVTKWSSRLSKTVVFSGLFVRPAGIRDTNPPSRSVAPWGRLSSYERTCTRAHPKDRFSLQVQPTPHGRYHSHYATRQPSDTPGFRSDHREIGAEKAGNGK